MEWIEYNACPVCHSTMYVTDTYKKEGVKKGEIGYIIRCPKCKYFEQK